MPDFRRCLARLISGGAVAPLVFRAPEGPAAREARRPHFVRRRASKPARALRTLRRPPHQCDLNVARNSSAATSNFEFASLQLQRLWIGSKSDRGKLCATFVWLWPCRRPPASEISRVKPVSPLRDCACVGLKPASPLRVRIGCFWRVFRLHWCCRFQWLLFWGEHW